MQPSLMLSPFAQSLNKADEWMQDVQRNLGSPNPDSVYRAVRGALHALRDQLIPNEAMHLAAQLPMLLRGLFFEGYHIASAPDRVRSCELFLQRVARELQPPADPGLEQAVCAVFATLQQHVSAGEIDDVRNMMPSDLQSLWPMLEVH